MRRYRGFAGHLIVSDSCRFHICTDVGDVLVSTVGAYVQPRREGEFTDIGYQRKYETMVFRLGGICACGCGEREVADWGNIDFAGYNTPLDATNGHETMCQKYELAPPAVLVGASANTHEVES